MLPNIIASIPVVTPVRTLSNASPNGKKYITNNHLQKIEEEAGLSNDDDAPDVPVDDFGDHRHDQLIFR